MIAMLRPQPHTGPIIQLKPPLLWLFHWHFEPLTSPQSLHTLVVHLPARIPQQGSNPAISVSTILTRQFDHVGNQPVFVRTSNRQPPLGGSMLIQNTADPSFRHPHLVANVIDASPATWRAQ